MFFCVLLLPSTFAVCQYCFGEAGSFGCTGSANTCPWKTGIAANTQIVTAIVAGTATAAFSITKLLPFRFRALFPRQVLDIISNIYAKPRNGDEFDPRGKSLTQVTDAISAGQYTKQEAARFWVGKMDDLDQSAENYDNRVKVLSSQLSIIRDTPNGSSANSSPLVSVYLFVLAKLSTIHCKSRDMAVVLDACMACDDDPGGPASSSSSSSPSSS